MGSPSPQTTVPEAALPSEEQRLAQAAERDAIIPANATPLISSTRCEVRGSLLWNCAIPDFTAMPPDGSSEEERNPAKTIVTVKSSGECDSFGRWLNVGADPPIGYDSSELSA
jgi:hypothetical protein